MYKIFNTIEYIKLKFLSCRFEKRRSLALVATFTRGQNKSDKYDSYMND